MLRSLYIQNYALIEKLDISFSSGFSVITGETGAGKSIILGAIGLLLGQRADVKAIRVGASKCIIEARFDISAYGMQPFFEENELEYEEECILRREVSASGKSRAFINDTPASLVQMKELGEQLIDVHSQHQNLLLNKEGFQLNVLDILSHNEEALSAYQHIFGAWKQAQQDLEALVARANQDKSDEDYIRFQLEQLEEAHLSAGEQEELEQFMDMARRLNVTVISDEIWSDLTLRGHQHIPLQSVSDDARQRTVALYAPSKTFNLAGLIGSYHIVYDPWWRDRIKKESSLCHYNSMNVLSMHALIGAYRPEGYEWADELCETLTGNVDFACDYIAKHFEGVHVTKPEGTYMLFVDCTDWCAAHGKTIQDVEKACWAVGAAVQDGVMFHGPCHLRINLASPRARIEEAFHRMDRYVFNAK